MNNEFVITYAISTGNREKADENYCISFEKQKTDINDMTRNDIVELHRFLGEYLANNPIKQ